VGNTGESDEPKGVEAGELSVFCAFPEHRMLLMNFKSLD
jgi:hypothetical protein